VPSCARYRSCAAHSRLRSKSDPRPFQLTAQSRPDLSLSVEERALRGSRSGRSWTAVADQFTMGLEPLIYSKRSAADQRSRQRCPAQSLWRW
jgi:hypothetical protein